MTVHGKAARALLKAVGVRTKRDKKPKITISNVRSTNPWVRWKRAHEAAMRANQTRRRRGGK